MKFYQTLMVICLLSVAQMSHAEELTAEVSWADVRQLGVPISGQVSKMHAAGSYLKSGDTLFTIACGLYKAQLEQQQSIANSLIPAVETALKDKELADELFERTVLSEVEHRSAELVYIKDKAKHNEALAKVKQAQIRVNFCELKADSPVVVLNEHVKRGEMYSQESAKPILMTVASRNTMLATSVLSYPLNKVYRVGLSVKVNVAGKNYNARIQSVNYLSDSVEIDAVFDYFEPRLIGNKTAKIIVQ